MSTETLLLIDCTGPVNAIVLSKFGKEAAFMKDLVLFTNFLYIHLVSLTCSLLSLFHSTRY